MALEITENEIPQILTKEGVTVLDFWAPWCGPCKMLSPVIDKLSKEFEANEMVNIHKLNVDENGNVAVEYGVRGIPTLIFLKDGKVADRMVGYKQQSEIEAKINELLQVVNQN